MTPVLPAVAGLFLTVGLAPLAAPGDAGLSELRKRADEVVGLGEVSGRAKAGVVFEYARLAAEAGLTDEALKYYEAGLRIHSLDYPMQLAYAELLAKAGKADLARRRADIVAKSAEDGLLVARARELLGEKVSVEAPPIAKPPGTGPVLILVPLGEMDMLLMSEIQKRLADEMGIEVLLRTAGFQMPLPRRTPRADFVSKLRQTLEQIKQESPKDFTEMLREQGLTEDALKDDGKTLRMFRSLVAASGSDQAVAGFDAVLERLDDEEDQWDLDEMAAAFRKCTESFNRPSARFLGITRKDVFAGDYGFLFGGTRGPWGVISCRRFMAGHTREVPDRARLIRRTLRQCLSSAGFLFGMKRCSDPTCPRSYSQSVSEQDRREEKLCTQCREQLDEVLGRKSTPSATAPATVPR